MVKGEDCPHAFVKVRRLRPSKPYQMMARRGQLDRVDPHRRNTGQFELVIETLFTGILQDPTAA